MYAVVETGGKQYRVAVGQHIDVEKLEAQPGDEIALDRVLMVSGDGQTTVGTPTVAGARVLATVDDQFRDDKVIVFKFHAKKRYRRKRGHRQPLTRLTIREIVTLDTAAPAIGAAVENIVVLEPAAPPVADAVDNIVTLEPAGPTVAEAVEEGEARNGA